MAIETNFNANPYYDDYDEDKKFIRMLFKPGYAVQARELTQLQTIVQKQVQRFGNHVFKNGSVVTGGQTFFQNAVSLNLESTFAGTSVTANNFIDQSIVDSITVPTQRALVVKAFDADIGTGDPKTLMIKQILGTNFANSAIIKTYTTDPTSANITANGVNTGQIFSVNEGVYYYEGFFVKNDAQTIAVSKYTTTANVRVGFEITESIVKSTADTSLLDPAQSASNYQAPGSDRFKIDLTLSVRDITSDDDLTFIELARIEGGVLTKYERYPIYSVLEDTLARRTYDESGNYTVRPFKLSLETASSNTANMNVILSSGKAYVFGYEYETTNRTVITIPKPRDTTGVTSKRITADYGYFIYANNAFNTLPINSLITVDLHCVPNATINILSTNSTSQTKIGTARVNSIQFDSSANTQNSSTYEYKAFLFDVNVGSLTGVANAAINVSNYIQLANTMNTGNSLYSTIDNAYRGAKLRITSGPGLGESAKLITNYSGTTKHALLADGFINPPTTASKWSIDFEFNDVKSLAVISTDVNPVRTAALDIAARSKDHSTTFDDTYIIDTTTQPLLFLLGESWIANNTISGLSLSYRRLYEGITFSGGLSTALTFPAGDALSSAASTTLRQLNYQIVCTTQGGSVYPVKSTVPAHAFTVDTAQAGTHKITVTDGSAMVANVYVTLDSTNPNEKAKSYVQANTSLQLANGVDIFANGGIVLYSSNGTIHIAANNVVKSPTLIQSLYVADVTSIVSISDMNGLNITQANISSAINVTSRYQLDTGQRDSFYDHANVRLKPKQAAPVGPLIIKFNKFTSSGSGFFNGDSYDPLFGYEYIPDYVSTSGITYSLRDCFDFRPIRSDPTGSTTANTVTFDVESSTNGPRIAENGSDIVVSYNYYLARNDKIVLNKDRTFEVIKGVSSLTPEDPKDKDNAMTLYTLRNPPYVANTANVSIQYHNHTRYTMRDIGVLEKRIENIEYYSSLSLLEQSAISKNDLTILDSNNLSRFKNGIIVDAFNGHSVADVAKLDYRASIDPIRRELRPAFNISAYTLQFDSANSSGVQQNGSSIIISTGETILIDQPRVTKAVSVNPYNVVNYIGKVHIDPQSDIWVDTQRIPTIERSLDDPSSKDAWDRITSLTSPFEYTWGSPWQEHWTGVPVDSAETQIRQYNKRKGSSPIIGVFQTTTTQTGTKTRVGTKAVIATSAVKTSIGDRVIDLSVVPFMRERGIAVVGADFKPNATLYPFFDGTLVEQYFARANKFYLATNNLKFSTELGNFEKVNIKNNTTLTVNGAAFVVRTSNTEAFIINNSPNTSYIMASANLVGETTGTTARIIGYDHFSGICQGANSTVITLSVDATDANNITDYNSSIIFITTGTGLGQSATIQSYNPSTRNVTISGTWTTTPVANNSIYSIGRMKTTAAGDVAGVFSCPASIFRTGEKRLRLIDNALNDVVTSATNGDTSFFASGLIEKVQDTILSITQPTVQRTATSQEEPITRVVGTRITERVIGWYDPLAQTFLVDPSTYPQGIFISKLRGCFKSKDDVVPITLQLRPTVNGVPSAAVIYPNGTVTLTPDKVNISDTPDLDDATKFTDFKFDSPVYLQPGEHSFVYFSNSNKYESYIATIGQLDIINQRQISEQPYGGSLFLSQNGSTWTAEQNSDMMFRIYRNVFPTTTASVKFKVIAPSSNGVYDLINLITNDLVISNTSVSYAFDSVVDGTGAATGFQSIIPYTDYAMTDGYGRRVVTTANSSFVLKATITTLNPAVSPVIDASRCGFIAIENTINQLPLRNSEIFLTASGSGYANSTDVTVTITGGGPDATGATAKANVNTTSGNVNFGTITTVYITNGGTGYTLSPTINIAAGSGGGNDANVSYNGEDKQSGGNSDVRYITRQVVLNDGFDSGDLRTYLTAYKPDGSNIYVYYKLLSKSDSDILNNKNYQLMTEIGNKNFVSTDYNDYRELLFAPGEGGSANNYVNYTTTSTGFSTFRTFAIKIVMSGSDTTDVPKVRDLRVIALPAG